MVDAARHVERGTDRGLRKRPPPSSAAVDVAPRGTLGVRALQRLVGNQVTGSVLQRTRAPIQRELKIDSYAWSWVGLLGMGFKWASGAEELHTRLKKAFEVDLPAAITRLDATGEEDLKQLAESLRGVQKKYDDQPLAYKKASGKLSGEELDTELTPLLSQVDSKITAKKLTLVGQIRDKLGAVGGYIGGQLQGHRGEYDRINALVPKGSTGSIALDIPKLRQLAGDAVVYESKMQIELENSRKAKLAQQTTPSPNAVPTSTAKSEIDQLKSYLKEQKGWRETETSTIMTDPSDVKIKMDVCKEVIGSQIGSLNSALRGYGLTLESVHHFIFDHGIRTIVDLNKHLAALGGEKALTRTLQAMGLEGLTTLVKRGVPTDFIAQHVGEDMITVDKAYKASMVVAPKAKVYDPFEGVDPTKDPLDYTTLEAFLQFHTLQIHAKGVVFTLYRTYNSSYDGENGIGGEYLPNNTTDHWVVHVHRGPNGGLKVGSIKTWDDRFILGHSQKLAVDKLTAAGIPQVDATRL